MASDSKAKRIVRYDKDANTRIATIRFDRPEYGKAPTIAAWQRYADLLHRAGVDDDVKAVVICGAGYDLGSRADLEEFMLAWGSDDPAPLLAEFRLGVGDVTYPLRGSFRHGASVGQWYANPNSEIRGLQDLKKISILEVKGYCYGFFESAGGSARPDGDDLLLDDAVGQGLGSAVRANDDKSPPEWRLSKKARRHQRKAKRE